MNGLKIERFSSVVNGLNVIVIPKPDFSESFAIYATGYGSIDNSFTVDGKKYSMPPGIAHFLEHKMFEKENGDIFDRFSEHGAVANAFTSFDMTGYLFSATGGFYESLGVLCELVNSPYFTSETVEKEREIIAREIEMGLDDPDKKCFSLLVNSLFHSHPIALDIAGTKDSISHITADDLYVCHDAFYRPSNTVLCVSGNVDAEKVFDTVKKNVRSFSSLRPETVFEKEPENIVTNRAAGYADISAPVFMIGFKDNVKKTGIELVKHKFAISLILDMICGRASSFYEKMRNGGLMNSAFGRETLYMQNAGAAIVTGESDEPETVLEKFIEEIEKFKISGPDENVFRRFKNKTYGIMLETLDSPEDLAMTFASDFLDGYSFEEVYGVLARLTEDDLRAALGTLDTEKLSMAVVYPENGGR